MSPFCVALFCPSAPVQVGSNSYEAAVGWIREQFECRNLDPASKTIYTHITCATDTSNVTAVFSAVKDIILRKNLGKVRRRGAGRGKAGCADGWLDFGARVNEPDLFGCAAPHHVCVCAFVCAA